MKSTNKSNKHILRGLTVFGVSILLSIILFILNDQRGWMEVFTLWVIPSLALAYVAYNLWSNNGKSDTFLYLTGSLLAITATEFVLTYLIVILTFGAN